MIPGLVADRPLSLYIHVPFCSRKCDYCDFYSLPGLRDDVIDSWLNNVTAEIDELNREWGKPYETVFLGGGNPGLLGVDRIGMLLEKVSECGRWKECTVETNPENLNEGFKYLSGLLTRLSVGIQSLDQEVLSTLGRNSSLEENLRALSLLPSLPFDFNCDLITAVPGEEIKTALDDIRRVSSFKPDHISYYCLSIEDGTPLAERIAPIGEEQESVFTREGWALLSALGYEHYEISNFAREGKRCRHNLVYWSLGQYAGLGAGAESSFGYSKVVSARENEKLSSYLVKPQRTYSELSKKESEEEYLMLVLRTSDGISKEEYKNRFNVSFDSRYQGYMQRLAPAWYLDTPERFSLTEEGFMLLDRIILELSMGIQ